MKRIICVFLTIVLFATLSAYGFAESEERLSADELLAKGQQSLAGWECTDVYRIPG